VEFMKSRLMRIYDRLLRCFGPRGWWPGDTTFEVMVGAILTQNTAWQNVEKAIANLKDKGLLNPSGLYLIPERELAELIRPAGYFNVKARRLKNFVKFLFEHYDGDPDRLAESNLSDLRQELLAINGVGPETADSILLYALNKPIFVVDAYTKRIFSRHNLIPVGASYSEVQAFLMDNLPRDVALYNEFHALVVHLGKTFCKAKPDCETCPIKGVG